MIKYISQETIEGYRQLAIHQAFKLDCRSQLKPLVLAYETIGKLNSRKSNAILIHHSLSTNSHVCAHEKNRKRGWWEELVGPGKAIDTNRYFVICINNLGSCFGSTGPASINPWTHEPYGIHFPAVTIGDMVRSQKLLLEYLGIEKLYAVIGNSMGAMLSLDFSIRYPQAVKKLISVSSCYKSYPVNIAYHVLQKQIILMDKHFGHEEEKLSDHFVAARKIALLSYCHPSELNERFLHRYEINRYLEYNARKFVRIFNVHAYIRILDAMDHFDVTANYKNKLTPFKKIKAKALVVSVDSDLLYPPQQQFDLYQMLMKARVDTAFVNHHSPFGHDAFYADLSLGKLIKKFLE